MWDKSSSDEVLIICGLQQTDCLAAAATSSHCFPFSYPQRGLWNMDSSKLRFIRHACLAHWNLYSILEHLSWQWQARACWDWESLKCSEIVCSEEKSSLFISVCLPGNLRHLLLTLCGKQIIVKRLICLDRNAFASRLNACLCLQELLSCNSEQIQNNILTFVSFREKGFYVFIGLKYFLRLGSISGDLVEQRQRC